MHQIIYGVKLKLCITDVLKNVCRHTYFTDQNKKGCKDETIKYEILKYYKYDQK